MCSWRRHSSRLVNETREGVPSFIKRAILQSLGEACVSEELAHASGECARQTILLVAQDF